jgi:hypothetical protein
MRFTSSSETSLDGVTEQSFTVGEIPGVVWTPSHGDRPKDAEFSRMTTRIRARVAAGEDPAALLAAMHELLAGQAVADWRTVITAVTAARVTVPVQFLLQWDDDPVPRVQRLALFDALA